MNRASKELLQSRVIFYYICVGQTLKKKALKYMEENIAIETTPTVAPETVVTPTTTEEGDAEARIAVLEEQKNKAIEEAANYKLAFLKEKNKGRHDEDFEDEREEERTRRIIKEELAQSKIQQIDTEKEMLLKKLARENKELKLANLNKTGTPVATVGTHSEGTPVTDTSVTPEQLAAFKAKGWTDKDIERYKGNLRRYSGR
jgi:hypothetical protein